MRLVMGIGAPGKGACWMSAITYYTCSQEWHDHPECVSPVIRPLAIKLNDICNNGEREELIGPHLFTPVGTAGDAELDIQRSFRCADVACRVWAPIMLEARSLHAEAKKMRSLARVTDIESANAAYAAASAYIATATATAAVAHAAYAAADAAAAATYAATAAFCAASFAADAAHAAADAAHAAAAADSSGVAVVSPFSSWASKSGLCWVVASLTGPDVRAVKRELLALILELCEMGERREIVPCRTKEQVIREVCV